MKIHSSRKKGAIELSMTTIIVIVIGVTLLSLGLMWVRGMFGNIEGLTDKAFLDADRILSQDQDFTGEVNLASTLTLEKGDKKVLVIRVRNLGNTADQFRITSVTPKDRSLEGCITPLIITDQSQTIEPNGLGTFEVGFASEKRCNPGSDFYTIAVDGTDIGQTTVVIKVE